MARRSRVRTCIKYEPIFLFQICSYQAFKTSRQSSVLINDSDRVITPPLDDANEFNKYFASVFTVDDGNLPDFPVRVNKELNSIRFDVLFITKVLKNLKPFVSFCLDNIPNVFLRRTERSITWPLSILFERSLSANYVPALWKTAKVVLLHKKRSTTSPANYRPISLSYPASLKLWNV